MNLKKIFILPLVIVALVSAQYSFAAPMEGVDDSSNVNDSFERGDTESNRPANLRKNDNKKDSDFLSIIALLLGLSGAGIGLLAFLKSNKLEQASKTLKRTYDKDANIMKSEVSNLSNLVSDLKIQLEGYKLELSKVTSSLRASSVQTRVSVPEQKIHATSDFHQKDDSQQYDLQSAPVKLYFGTPIQGIFTSPSTNYVPGKSLYYILTSQGSNTAQYSYIDNSDAASIASRSITRFVEVGCVIRGEVRNNFSKIVTVKPGTVSKTPSGWKIDAKALVELV